MRRYLAYGEISLALILWVLALKGRLLGQEPYVTFLYQFAWWPYILFLDGLLLQLKGKSLLFDRPGDFCRLAVWSVTAWLVFEAFNFILANWRYVGLLPNRWGRWPGYALAFATVLPGILLTAQALEALGAWRGLKGASRNLGYWQPCSLTLGVALLVLPLMAPAYAFPLVWSALIFLLDPFCDLLGGKSLIRRWAAGERGELLCLLTAGLICGVWWELWNYPAGAKWVYALPVLNFGKIFEMPVLGYLGFPPFALECAVIYNFLSALESTIINTTQRRRVFYLLQGIFWVVMFAAIDAWTVMSFR